MTAASRSLHAPLTTLLLSLRSLYTTAAATAIAWTTSLFPSLFRAAELALKSAGAIESNAAIDSYSISLALAASAALLIVSSAILRRTRERLLLRRKRVAPFDSGATPPRTLALAGEEGSPTRLGSGPAVVMGMGQRPKIGKLG